MGKIRRLKKKIHLHHEGQRILLWGGVALLAINALLWYLCGEALPWLFGVVFCISATAYGIALNFFRCPQRIFEGDTEHTVVAPADGKVVVVEEVDEQHFVHGKCIMVSVFMSLTNVHANWFPVDGVVRHVSHQDGNYHYAWLPKASEENERSAVVIETKRGECILVRQIAGALARRIVTYAREGELCFIDEHMGFIKFGSRVDVYLPTTARIRVKLGQHVTGNQTVIAELASTATAESTLP